MLVPKPVPFLHFGFANAVIMIAAFVLPFTSFLLLLLLKVLGQAVLTGSALSYIFVFSLAGSFASGICSFVLAKLLHDKISFIGISCAAAAASNLAQLLLAYFFIFGRGTFSFAAIVLLFGFFSSLGLGFFVTVFTEKSYWYKSLFLHDDEIPEQIRFEYKQVRQMQKSIQESCTDDTNHKNSEKNKKIFFAKLLVLLIIMVLNFFLKGFLFKCTVFVFSLLVCIFSKTKINVKAFFIFALSIFLVNMFQYNGEVLFTFWIFTVTKNTLVLSLEKIFTFQSILFFSKWIFSTRVVFSGRFGLLLAKSFNTFYRLQANAHLLDRKNILGSLDRLLLSFHGELAQ